MVAEIPCSPIVEVQGFCKHYRKQMAVENVDLTIHAGEIYGLIGPDGSGKSSLMKVIAGVTTYDSGTVEVLGVRVDSEVSAEKVKGRIGFMPQGLGLNLYAELSVEENIDFFAQLREVPPHDLVERKRRLLSMTRLDKFLGRPMKQLSGGMKQKLGLVCTLIHEPEIVILDEPTTGVDPVSRRDFWAILAELLRERGITALISTAYMDEATRFRRLTLMYGGRMLAEGEPDDIRQIVSGSLLEIAVEPQVEALQRLKIQYPQVETVGRIIRVFLDNILPEEATKQVKTTLEGLPVSKINPAEIELEDAFVFLLRQHKLAEQPEVEHAVTSLAVAPPHDEVAIEARSLTRNFGHFRAVDQVNFKVMQGEIAYSGESDR